MDSEKYDFGVIDYFNHPKDKTRIARITGKARHSPRFINEEIDEKIWKNFWYNKSSEVNAFYIHGQDRFDKYKNASFAWSEAEAKEESEKVKSLVEEYDKAAKDYNEKIRRPFIEERKKTLGKILDSN